MPSTCDNPFYTSLRDKKLHEMLLNKEYSLNAANNYGDNLLHISAAYGCTVSVKTILNQNKNSLNIDRKNKFGWTALMHAVRGNNIETVKILLQYGADVTQRTYLGTSTLTLAAGIGLEMFKTIHKACPSMLENSVDDDITPLCVAAMKNDKKLFSKLIELGMDVNHESACTHLVMQQSVFPEIQSLAKPQKDIENYWNDQSNMIKIIEKGLKAKNRGLSDSLNNGSTVTCVPSIFIDSPKEGLKTFPSNYLNNRKETKLPNLDLLRLKEARYENDQSISPNLIYNLEFWYTKSPNFANSPNPISKSSPTQAPSPKSAYRSCPKKEHEQRNIFVFDVVEKNPRHSAQFNQSSDQEAENDSAVHNMTLTFVPEYSPSRSPCLPSDYEDEDVCGEDTPTPPHYKTPPQGMVLNSEQSKLVIVLKQFDLAHHISKFLAEEVDMNLFLTLNDQDLTEIGIANEQDRKALLAVIHAYIKNEK